MHALASAYRDRAFRMIAVTQDEDPEALVSFLRETGMTGDDVLILQDPNGELTAAYGTRLLPETYMIDRSGQVFARFMGLRDWSSEASIRMVERLLAADGPLDRLLGEGGALDRVVAEEGVLERLLQPGGPVDRLTQPGGLLELVLRPDGLADRMLTDDGFVERLLADGGTLDQLVALGDTLESIQPRLAELAEIVPTLSTSADALHRAVGPLGELAGRLPLSRRRPLPAGSQA